MKPQTDIEKLSRLLTGSGARDFEKVKKLSEVFCPFEAIGMVSQEIRHSTFLSFILDSNRPHNFGSDILYELLKLIAEKPEFSKLKFSELDLHLMDIAETSILREWQNIDLVIELPAASYAGRKKTVLAVELKIHAGEHGDQLERYEKTILSKYKSNQWNHVFVFLTLNENDTNADSWIPISLPSFVLRIEEFLLENEPRTQSADLLRSYIAMIKRNLMQNRELDNLVRKIWAKHEEALELIIRHKPNPEKELKRFVYENKDRIILELSERLGRAIALDKSTESIIRFAILDWDKTKLMKTGQEGYLPSKRIFIIEAGWQNSGVLQASFVIWPGNEDVRFKLYELAQNEEGIVIKGKNKLNKYQHLSSEDVIDEKLIFKFMNDKISSEDLVDLIVNSISNYLKNLLPIYDDIVKDALN